MRKFLRAMTNTLNYHPSQTQHFSTRNIHQYENLHSALRELAQQGECDLYYINCRSQKALIRGEIDHYYTPKQDEVYSTQLTVEIERSLTGPGLAVFYKFRAAQFYVTPVRKKVMHLKEIGETPKGSHDEYSVTVLRNLSLQNVLPNEKLISQNLYSPFSALESLKKLKNTLKKPD